MSQRGSADPDNRPDRHRRVGVVVAVAATVAVVAGVTGASGALSTAGPGLPSPSPDPTPSRLAGGYDSTPVPRAEVVRRCTEQFISAPEPSVRAASDWGLRPRPEQTLQLGTQVVLTAPGVAATCTIPEADLAIGSGPASFPIDTTGGSDTVVRECSRVAGYDFAGWSVTTRMATGDGFAAVLRSRNYYVATCQVGPLSDGPGSQSVEIQAPIASAASPYVADLRVLRRDALEIAPPDRGVVYTGAGMLFDAKGWPAFGATTLRLAFPDGTVITRPVVDATYAVRAFVPGPVDVSPVTVTVLDAQGVRLARYQAD